MINQLQKPSVSFLLIIKILLITQYSKTSKPKIAKFDLVDPLEEIEIVSSFVYPQNGGNFELLDLKVEPNKPFHLIYDKKEKLSKIAMEESKDKEEEETFTQKLMQKLNSNFFEFELNFTDENDLQKLKLPLNFRIREKEDYLFLIIKSYKGSISFNISFKEYYFNEKVIDKIDLSQKDNNNNSIEIETENSKKEEKKIQSDEKSINKTEIKDSIKRYLSYEMTYQIPIKFLFFLIFCLLSIIWINYCLKNALHSKTIHFLLTLLILSKTILLFTESLAFKHFNLKGSHDYSTFLFYLVLLFKTITFFSVMVLLSTGWSYLKPFLSSLEKKILLIVLGFQCIFNICFVMSEESKSSLGFKVGLKFISFLLEILCFFVSFYLILSTVENLKKSIHVDGKAFYNIVRLKQFNKFYSIIMSFFFLTRFCSYFLSIFISPFFMWIFYIWEGIVDLIFYILLLHLFRPKKLIVQRKRVEGLEIEDVSFSNEEFEIDEKGEEGILKEVVEEDKEFDESEGIGEEGENVKLKV